MRMRSALVFALASLAAAQQTQYVGIGKTTATCIDKDGDGYGVGPGCLGPDADDTDASVHTAAQAVANYGSLLAFIQHLGYNPARIWYFDATNGSDSKKCVASAASFDPESTPRCQHYNSGSQVVAGNAGLGGFKPGDLFLFRAGTVQQTKFDARMICTPTSPCTFLVYPGETFTIDAAKTPGGDGITLATGYDTPLCNGIFPCTLHYEDYSLIQDSRYVTVDGFTLTNSAGYLGQGLDGYGGDHITARNIHEYHMSRGSFFSDGMSNLLVEKSVFHDDNSSHCSYWGSRDGIPRNVTFRGNLLYNCGLPHFQFNGRAEGMTVEGNILWGDVGTETPGLSLMQGGGTAPGYTSYVRNNLVYGVCNEPVGIVDYPDVVTADVFQWPVNNLIIENNTFVYPKFCSANGAANYSNAVIFMSTEGLNEAAGGPPWNYSGADISTGVVIRNNVLVDEATSASPSPFIGFRTRSSTYGCYSGACGPVTGDANAPDNVEFTDYGKRDPRVEAARLTIQNNYFYSPNFKSTAYLEADNCVYGTATTSCVKSGSAPLPPGYAGLTSIMLAYDGNGLKTLNSANTNNVVTNANPKFTHVVFTDPWEPAPLMYSYAPLSGSPLIAAGSSVNAPTADIANTLRPNPPSIGAYELPGPTAPLSGGTNRCDINGDGIVNVLDLQTLINAVLTGSCTATIDLNGDGHCDVTDIQVLATSIATGVCGAN